MCPYNVTNMDSCRSSLLHLCMWDMNHFNVVPGDPNIQTNFTISTHCSRNNGTTASPPPPRRCPLNNNSTFAFKLLFCLNLSRWPHARHTKTTLSHRQREGGGYLSYLLILFAVPWPRIFYEVSKCCQQGLESLEIVVSIFSHANTLA